MLNSYEAILDHGQLKWLDQAPPLEHARVIVTVLPATSAQPTRRKPPASLAGKVRENGDVMSSLTADDWGMDS
jgi:hypothetical protein